MNDVRWTRVTTCDNIPPREGRAVSLAGREIAIFNLGPSTELGAGDRFLAVENQCPHKAGPLADGIITGTSVVCPLHNWKVNLESGCVERPSSSSDRGVPTYPVHVEEGVLVVGMPVVTTGADNDALKFHNCLVEMPLLHERSLDPPCPHVEGCVSSTAGGPRA